MLLSFDRLHQRGARHRRRQTEPICRTKGNIRTQRLWPALFNRRNDDAGGKHNHPLHNR